MHILVAVLGVLGVGLLILWRLNKAANAARGIGGAADDARGAWRRWSRRRKSTLDLLRDIDDPRVAAAVMTVAIAEHDAAFTDAESNMLRQQIANKLGVSGTVADELIAHARCLNRNGGDIGSFFLERGERRI